MGMKCPHLEAVEGVVLGRSFWLQCVRQADKSACDSCTADEECCFRIGANNQCERVCKERVEKYDWRACPRLGLDHHTFKQKCFPEMNEEEEEEEEEEDEEEEGGRGGKGRWRFVDPRSKCDEACGEGRQCCAKMEDDECVFECQDKVDTSPKPGTCPNDLSGDKKARFFAFTQFCKTVRAQGKAELECILDGECEGEAKCCTPESSGERFDAARCGKKCVDVEAEAP